MMHNPLSTRRSAVLYLLVWLFLGGILGTLIVISANIGWVNGFLFAIPITTIYAYATGYSVYYLCRAYPLAEKVPAQVIPVFGVAAIVSGLFWTASAYLWNALWLSAGLEWAGIELSRALSVLIFGLGVVLYGLSAVVHYLVIEFERTQVAERRELESKLLAQDAELRMLRTQIDPHFLFNSLNSISALTSQNPAGARRMTLQLADYFRRSMGLGAHEKITLDAEIVLTLTFLAIEKVRFGTRMTIEEAVDDAAKEYLVPPLIIQPLVENAVKHGIANLIEGGIIRIAAQRLGSILRITIENTIDRNMPNAKRTGIGLDNVRQRLAAAYGREARISWTRQQDLFRVEISMPAETPDPID